MRLLRVKVAGVSLLLLVLAAIALASTGTVVALAVTQTTRQLQVRAETIISDTDSTVVPVGWRVASTTVAATGTTYSTRTQITGAPFPTANTDVTVSNWYYQLDLQEAAAGSWATTTEYAVKVYFDGALQGTSGTTTIFLTNTQSFPSSVEGMTIQVGSSSSSTIPDTVVVQIERTAN